jgi:hypothetical protein
MVLNDRRVRRKDTRATHPGQENYSPPKGRIHLRRLVFSTKLFPCSRAADHPFVIVGFADEEEPIQCGADRRGAEASGGRSTCGRGDPEGCNQYANLLMTLIASSPVSFFRSRSAAARASTCSHLLSLKNNLYSYTQEIEVCRQCTQVSTFTLFMVGLF